MEVPPDPDSMEFRQALEDVICKIGGGPELRRGLARLMKNPYYREAHGTDDHYVSACFVAGAIGDAEDRGTKASLGAEAWELVRSPLSLDLVSYLHLANDFNHSGRNASVSLRLGNGPNRGKSKTLAIRVSVMYDETAQLLHIRVFHDFF